MSWSKSQGQMWNAVTWIKPNSRIFTRKFVRVLTPRDKAVARQGFGEEFPLLCALHGASIVPEVLVRNSVTHQLERLLPKEGYQPEEALSIRTTSVPTSVRPSVGVLQTPPRESSEVQADESEGSKDDAASRTIRVRSTLSRIFESAPVVARTPSMLWKVPSDLNVYSADPAECDKKKRIYPYVEVTFADPDKEAVSKISMNGYPVDEGIIAALGNYMYWSPTLHSLDLKNCELTSTGLELLVKYLSDTHVVQNLNLSGNPIPEQNHYKLLHADTRLERLSLAHCNITPEGALKIAKELGFSSPQSNPQTLQYLNLSDNKIGDQGVIDISKALRTNRTLKELQLQRAAVSDRGLAALADMLQAFALTPDEWEERRQLGTRFHNTMALVSDHRPNVDDDSKKRQISSKKSLGRESSKLKFSITKKKIPLESPNHPFIWDTRPKNLDLWCVGNMKLEHLNLADNLIHRKGAQKLLAAITYQKDLKDVEQKEGVGLKSVFLQGNPIPERSFELGKLDEILNTSLRSKVSPKLHLSHQHHGQHKRHHHEVPQSIKASTADAGRATVIKALIGRTSSSKHMRRKETR